LVQVGDTYHIYHQYDPFDAAHGGPVLWNHLTTKDFVTYENRGPALFPDSDLDSSGAYSGSAFMHDGKIHYFYTGNVKHFDRDDYDYVLTGRDQNQIHMVTENPDKLGEKRIAVGPVDYPDDISTHVRDPKILEHDGIYYMVLGARTKDDRGCVLVYTSHDLECWKYATRIELGEKFGFMYPAVCLSLMASLFSFAVRRACPPMVGVTKTRISACGFVLRPIGRRLALKSPGRVCPRWSMRVLTSMPLNHLQMPTVDGL
jgi:sucrose-6-phosphate hydrolase SacC (GH32 family)